MVTFNEAYAEEGDYTKEDLTQEALLKKILEKMDKEQIRDLEETFIQAAGEKGMAIKFVRKLVSVFVTGLIETRAIAREDKHTKTNELIEKIGEVTKQQRPQQKVMVFERDGSYFVVNAIHQIKKITNWVITAKQIITYPDGQQKTFITVRRDDYFSQAELDHTSMESVPKFESLLKLNDNNIYLSTTAQEFSEMFKPYFSAIPSSYVYSEDFLGLHYSHRTEEPIFIYPAIQYESRRLESKVLTPSIEPMDQNRMCVTEPATKVKYEHLHSDDERFKRILRAMVSIYPKVNQTEKTITVLGWFMASLLSSYLKERKGNQFPILYLTGNGEDGKSLMVEYCSRFIGHRTGTGLTMASTPKPIRLALTGSNAHPAILEEANAKDPKVVLKVIDMLKSAYDNHDIEVGKIRGTNDYKLVNPVCIISNYNINDPALMTRCIKIEILASDWKQSKNAQLAYTDMESMKQELNKESYRIIDFFITHHQEWDNWYHKAIELSLADEHSSSAGRFTKSLVAIAFGLVVMQRLMAQIGMEEFNYFSDRAIKAHSDWLKRYLLREKSKVDLEGQFLQFVVRKQREHRHDDYYRYDPNSIHSVSINRAYWLDLFMEYMGKDFELKNIPRSAVDRATQVKQSKAIIATHRPYINGQKTTFHVIDIGIAEKEFDIEPFEWRNPGVEVPGLPILDVPEDEQEQQ